LGLRVLPVWLGGGLGGCRGCGRLLRSSLSNRVLGLSAWSRRRRLRRLAGRGKRNRDGKAKSKNAYNPHKKLPLYIDSTLSGEYGYRKKMARFPDSPTTWENFEPFFPQVVKAHLNVCLKAATRSARSFKTRYFLLKNIFQKCGAIKKLK
jgi:hypothetical protein